MALVAGVIVSPHLYFSASDLHCQYVFCCYEPGEETSVQWEDSIAMSLQSSFLHVAPAATNEQPDGATRCTGKHLCKLQEDQKVGEVRQTWRRKIHVNCRCWNNTNHQSIAYRKYQDTNLWRAGVIGKFEDCSTMLYSTSFSRHAMHTCGSSRSTYGQAHLRNSFHHFLIQTTWNGRCCGPPPIHSLWPQGLNQKTASFKALKKCLLAPSQVPLDICEGFSHSEDEMAIITDINPFYVKVLAFKIIGLMMPFVNMGNDHEIQLKLRNLAVQKSSMPVESSNWFRLVQVLEARIIETTSNSPSTTSLSGKETTSLSQGGRHISSLQSIHHHLGDRATGSISEPQGKIQYVTKIYKNHYSPYKNIIYLEAKHISCRHFFTSTTPPAHSYSPSPLRSKTLEVVFQATLPATFCPRSSNLLGQRLGTKPLQTGIESCHVGPPTSKRVFRGGAVGCLCYAFFGFLSLFNPKKSKSR